MTDTGFIVELLTHPTTENINLLGLQVALNQAIAVCSEEEHHSRQLRFEFEVRDHLERLAQEKGSIEAAGWQIKYVSPGGGIHAIAVKEHPELTSGRRQIGYACIHPEADILRPIAQELKLLLVSDYLTWSAQVLEQKQQRMDALQQALLQSGLIETDPLNVPAITAFVRRWTKEHPAR